MPTPIPAATIEKMPMSSKKKVSNDGLTKKMANMPITTDGTEASVSMTGLTIRCTFGFAYSDR